MCNKNTFIQPAIEVSTLIDAMIDEEYVFTEDEKKKLLQLMFAPNGNTNKIGLMANAVDFINTWFN